jgi:hypothetical protein
MPDKRLYIEGMPTPPPGQEVCDFCSDVGNVGWAYPTRTEFEIGKPVKAGNTVFHIDNIGWWAACQPCHRLIQQTSREGLAQRAMRNSRSSSFLPDDVALAIFREAHDSFWRNRQGGEPITVEQYRQQYLPAHEQEFKERRK